MKILAPLRHPGEVAPLCEAGADEFYCGLTPAGWAERFGGAWVHRRNPSSAGVPGPAELDEIVRLAAPRPVFATLNAPAYPAGALPVLADFSRALLEEHGVSGLIVADLDLLLCLRERGFGGRLHLSSLATCVNPGAAAFFRELGVSRVILPRHLSLEEIEGIAASGVETEVFLLNDGCVFEEGLCATTHAVGPFCLADGDGAEGMGAEVLERYALWKWTLNNCGCTLSRGYQLGPCGLCALPRFLRAGVVSLKVVGREASLARKAASVHLAHVARRLTLAGSGPEGIRAAVVGLRGAEQLCEGALLCYYPDVWEPPAAEEVAC